VKPIQQPIFLIVIISMMLLFCIGGVLAGFVTAARMIHPTLISVTKISIYELKITQLVGGATYTPYPTYTPIPPRPTVTVPNLALQPSLQFTPATIPAPSLTPTPLAIQLVAVSWNVYAGGEAFIKVRTLPGEKCAITFLDPHDQVSSAIGLVAQLADASGFCTWKWLVDSKTEPGTATITIQAAGVTQSFWIQILKNIPTQDP
jgi:hypothetical protein